MTEIGLFGPENTFHDLARKRHFPESSPVFFKSFDKIFRALEEKKIDNAIIALENTLAGKVLDNEDRIQRSQLTVVQTFHYQIDLYLASRQSNKLMGIKKIFSHPMAIKETQKFFSKYSHIKFIASGSSSGAIEEMKNSFDKHSAVICSKEASMNEQLIIIAESIQDEDQNFTKFALVKA